MHSNVSDASPAMYSNAYSFTSSATYVAIADQKLPPDGCSKNIMRYPALQSVGDALQCGFIPSLFLVGTPANILSMIVFYRQGLRDRMNLCLFCLAFVDLSYVTALFTMYSSCVIGIFLPDQKQFWGRILVKNTLNLVNGFSYASSCLTMIIATERCVCVLFPMHIAMFVHTKTMAAILVTTLCLTQLLCGVYAVKEKITVVRDVATGRYLTVLTSTDLFLSQNLFTVIENVVLPFIAFSTFTGVLLSTALTVATLRSAHSWRKATASSYLKNQALLVKMLVVVSCIYILCTAPNVALALARFTVAEFRTDGIYCSIFFATHMIGFTMVMLNSSINFFVYAIMSSRFRRELKTVFLCGSISVVAKPSLASCSAGPKRQ